MEKTVVILENDHKITEERHRYTSQFLNHYDGKQVHLCGLRSRENEEILEAFKNCTDIVFQSCLIGGSESQVEEYLGWLGDIKNPININMAYIGSDLKDRMQKWMEDNLSDKVIYNLKHHTCIEMTFGHPDNKYSVMDFSHIYERYEAHLAAEAERLRSEKEYRDTEIIQNARLETQPV